MKKLLLALTVVGVLSLCLANRGKSADAVRSQTAEYATIRWAGLENTFVIRPSGQTEFIGDQLAKLKRPGRADARSFYLNAAMNALAKEGYEFAGISSDDIVMKRAVNH